MNPRVRPMTEADADRVATLEREIFSAPWSGVTFRRLLGRDDVTLRVLDLPAEGTVGYGVLFAVADQGEIANIAVRDAYRGRGLGGMLLDDLISEARKRGVRDLHLEVRESNERALEMYRRRGFTQIGRRRDYYARPREDALVLTTRLESAG